MLYPHLENIHFYSFHMGLMAAGGISPGLLQQWPRRDILWLHLIIPARRLLTTIPKMPENYGGALVKFHG